MRYLRSVIAAFSYFSAIPMPYIDWDDDATRFMMAAFPLVGIVIGCCLGLWCRLADVLGFGQLLRATGLTLIPLALTGGIHMDGFADVVDAHASHASRERQQEILKDPHVGAFAIMGVCSYLLAYLAFVSEITPAHQLALWCVPVFSRCLSGLATVLFSSARPTGMYATEHASSDRQTVRTALIVLFVVVAVPLFFRDPVVALPMLAAAAGTLVATKNYAERSFGGMSGDLAGFFLQVVELVMVVCIALLGKMV